MAVPAYQTDGISTVLLPARGKRARRLRSLIDDYLEAAGGTASALAMDFFRSAAMTQWRSISSKRRLN